MAGTVETSGTRWMIPSVALTFLHSASLLCCDDSPQFAVASLGTSSPCFRFELDTCEIKVVALELQCNAIEPHWQATNCVCKQCTCEFTDGFPQRFAGTSQTSSGGNSQEDFLACTFYSKYAKQNKTSLWKYKSCFCPPVS